MSKDEHGISCNCSRCVGLRLYPQPSMCDWCKTIHAGDANNCPDERPKFEGLSEYYDDPTIEPLCSEVERQVRAITAYVRQFTGEENYRMLPRAGSSTTSTDESRPRAGKRTDTGIQYLKNEDLSSKTDKEGKILGVRLDEENKFGVRIILKLALDGKTVFFGVNIKKNPNYKILLDEFGAEENDWVGKRILLKLEQDEFTETFFPRVSFPETTAVKKGRV